MAALAASLLLPGAVSAHASGAQATCALPGPSAAQTRRTFAALASGEDELGERLLDAPGGPSASAAAALLPPLFYARAAHRTSLTASGAYYLPFAEPVGALGAGAVSLQLGDGSELLAGNVKGRSLTLSVGRGGGERYGSCLSRLATPALAAGFLPVLETRYRDAAGVRYHEESFAATVPALTGLVAYARLTIDARAARSPVEVRFTLSSGALHATGGRVLAGADTVLLATPSGRLAGRSLVYAVAPGTVETITVAFPNRPSRTGALPPLARLYARARRSDIDYWEQRLSRGAAVAVPEPEVDDAEKALLIQELVLGYRYSVGNAYQEFSFPETIDVARVLGEWGYAAADRAILRLSLSRPPTSYPNWTRGEKLLGTAEAYALDRDGRFLAQMTPALAGYVATIARELSPRSDLLPPEHYSSDIPLDVYGLPAQTVVWQGLETIARAWALSGRPRLAARARALAAALHGGLERALAASVRRLPDGSLFVPAILLGGERPYAALTRSRLGSYWNLVMPYALASGFFRPASAEARGILAYLRRHGALLLGLVRAGAYALYGRDAPAPVSGTDEVYGVNLARFLADNGQAGELVLALDGELADAMTPGTFVAGEAASVAPLPGERDRAMYLPPNSAANASFLETLRLLLVEERDGTSGQPQGLELGFATPRRWLEPGDTIRVSRLPTSFGPVSFTIAAATGTLRALVVTPPREAGFLRLRLRLPGDERIGAVTLDGRPFARVDRASATLDLSGLRGRLELRVRLR